MVQVDDQIDDHAVYARAFRASADAITISRLEDGVILDANEAFCSLVGFAQEEVLGKTAVQLGIYKDPSDRARMVRRVLHRGSVSEYDVDVRSKRGEQRTVTITADVVTSGNELQLFAIGRDATERRQRELDNLRELERLQRAEARCKETAGTQAAVPGGDQLFDLTDADSPA
jgi:PAS domain S-box-containing protein